MIAEKFDVLFGEHRVGLDDISRSIPAPQQ